MSNKIIVTKTTTMVDVLCARYARKPASGRAGEYDSVIYDADGYYQHLVDSWEERRSRINYRLTTTGADPVFTHPNKYPCFSIPPKLNASECDLDVLAHIRIIHCIGILYKYTVE